MKTYCSVLVKKRTMLDWKTGEDLKKTEAGIKQLESDILFFGSCVRKMTNDLGRPIHSGADSLHVRYKKDTSTSDYFVTNIECAAKGVRSSARECLIRHIDSCKHRVSQMEDKIKSLNDQIKNAKKIKASLIVRSRAKAEKKRLPLVSNYFNSGIKVFYKPDGSSKFEVSRTRLSSKRKKRPDLVFENEYLFELLYLDPYIRTRKQRIHQIQGRIHNLKRKIEKLEWELKNQVYHVCFGGKDLFRKRHENGTNASQWRQTYQKKRRRELLLVGRKDASQGNFLVRYDIKTRTLTYLSTKNTRISLPGVRFPYGQENIDMAVSASEIQKKNKKLPPEQQIPCWERGPVTWSIKDCGNAFLVKCMIEIPDNPNMNSCFSDGCIGIDKNYDHFAVSDINEYGQLVKSFVVPFKMNGQTSNQITNNISEALEKVFKFAVSVKKPVVMEEIQDIKSNFLYGNRKANRKISDFAYGKMDTLAESKAQKYGVVIRKVNPAYTSQIGKLKYMRSMGLSVHEAASYVIGRRGMGFKEKVPKKMRFLVSKAKKGRHHWAQWASISSSLKKIPTHAFYRKFNYSDFKNKTALIKYLAE